MYNVFVTYVRKVGKFYSTTRYFNNSKPNFKLFIVFKTFLIKKSLCRKNDLLSNNPLCVHL